ncbi:MAG: ABC transporter substrate-binding protein [Polyangiaceae bacterium]|nr:ABC transporter substrate-binding protein [Polyangiaceae bacterium]
MRNYGSMMRRIFSVAVAVAALSLPASVGANPAAEARLKDKQGQLTAEVAKPAPDRARVDSLFDELIDYEAFAKDSLGKSWADLNDDQRREFTDLLKRLVRAAYRKNLEKTKGYDVEFKGFKKKKRGVVVMTVAKHRKNTREEPVTIDYVMRLQGDEWRVVDIVTERSSLTRNYRRQFQRVIRKESFAALVDKMKKKLAKEERTG